jgi:transmembrane sensor
MQNSFNHIEDFLANESFRSWVLNPTLELDEFWQHWMIANPDKKELLLLAKDVVIKIRFREYHPESGSKERILKEIRLDTGSWNQPKKTIFMNPWLKIAASIFFVIALGTMAYFMSIQPKNQEQVASIEMIFKENPMGVRTQHTLPDGSIVHLNAGSKLEYPATFQQDKREIYLEGEAYFEVLPDSLRPFNVITNGLEVAVLGTKFNVISNDEVQLVALLEGSVRVFDNSSINQLILTPGYKAVLDPISKEITTRPFDKALMFGWVKGKLVFRDASFDEVVDRLTRWYGVTFSVSNQSYTPEWSYTGTFHNESLEKVLLNMCIIRDFDYQITNDSVLMSF